MTRIVQEGAAPSTSTSATRSWPSGRAHERRTACRDAVMAGLAMQKGLLELNPRLGNTAGRR